jgi:indole-3-glycerol phosphate synthase
MNILDNIAEKTKKRIADEKDMLSINKLMEMVENSRNPLNFCSQFKNDELNIISEIKLASPSEGLISNKNPLEVAEDYLKNGAAALSILTEPDYFKGNLDYIVRIRKKYNQANILMKDFVIDEYQLLKARVFGADAVLLIVSLLGENLTKTFLEKAKSLGLSVLVEVHDEDEIKIAVNCGANFIGVNNRNLKDMTISLKTSERLADFAPKETILISESGLKTRDDLLGLKSFGYKGFLIGTSLMKSGNPGKALSEILGKNYES